ncbi:hypothetical protein K439DRAFT_219760 [Ramaria rubella]|nr:hypothetical protein K439DRAFT_219760 [Ramaria rubella]
MAPQPQADDKQESSSTQFDLEDFLSKLTLQPMVHGPGAPPMPPHDARSTMTPLVMRPGRHRKLYEIKGLAYLEQEATLFFSRASPRVENGEVFKSSNLSTQMASNPEQLQVAKYNPYEVDDRNAARFVTDRGPMKDAQQLAQKIDPELRELRFFTPRSDGALNDQNIDPIFFCKVDEKGYMNAVKCVVVLLPPWEFAPRDFDEFSTMATFDEGSANNNEQGDLLFCNADLMWAYIYDLCFMHECQHFILTTYEQWVFGGFSTYYSTGFVSQVIPWNFKPNSVLELLTYWILTACHMDDTIILEKVSTEADSM